MLIYDGDCAFCTTSADWIRRRLPEGYPVVPWQRLDSLERLDLAESDVRDAAWWIEVDGSHHRGARAIARALIACGGTWSIVGWVLLVPPISWFATLVYALVARFRHRLPGGTPACRIEPRERPVSR